MALDVTATSSTELTIKWQPPQEPNGNVTHYVVTGSLIKDDETILDQRNYCNERKYSRLFRCNIVTDPNLGCAQCFLELGIFFGKHFFQTLHAYL